MSIAYKEAEQEGEGWKGKSSMPSLPEVHQSMRVPKKRDSSVNYLHSLVLVISSP